MVVVREFFERKTKYTAGMESYDLYPQRTSEAEASFLTLYEALNPEQKKAVDTVEGPLMVLAGPGTGKTQVVALRVANILRQTQARPGNILCLTYSVSGATAMRERLSTIIGADAYRVTISTIHGFCNEIIQRHPQVFEDFSALQQTTDIDRLRLIHEIIDELPVGSLLIHPKDRYGRTADILARIAEIKREGIVDEDLLRAKDAYRVEMEKKSKPGTKIHVRNLRDAARFSEFVQVFQRYNELLRERGNYDYEDMIRFVLKALNEEDWLLSGLQEKYMYILVDEFQDTNGAQSAIIDRLCTYGEGLDQEPNICVVGDDDQAIYRFQGANVRTMLHFRERFSLCPIITLQTSYRSTQEILDASMSLIEHNSSRIVGNIPGVLKNLRSGIAAPKGDHPIMMRPVSEALEPTAIAKEVSRCIEKGIEPSEIAVLTRKNNGLFPLYDAIVAEGITAQITGKLSLLRHPKVLQILTIARAILHVEDDVCLAQALAAETFACHPADLARLWMRVRSDRAEKKREENFPMIHQISVLEDCPVEREKLANPDALFSARNLLIDLSLNIGSRTLPETMEILLRKSKLVPEEKHAIAPIDLIALTEFYEHTKKADDDGASYGLRQFLDDIAYREEYGLPLHYAIPHMVENGVSLMTAHASKGLEFHTVILADFREGQWEGRRVPPRFSLPDHLIFGKCENDEASIEDERRLAYVAWTRAKKTLIISCPKRIVRGDREEDCAPSAFVSEGEIEEKREESDEKSAEVHVGPLAHPPIILDGHLEAFLRQRLESFELSVTALNRFLQSPESFFWEDMLAVPKAKSAELAYGSSVHAALEAWGKKVQRQETCSFEEMFAAFREHLHRSEILTKRSREELMHLGSEALHRYYETRLQSQIPIIFATELRLAGKLHDVRLKGLLDRIDLEVKDGARIHILDYKTGAPKTENQVRSGYGGSLFRQLVFYNILCRISPAMIGYVPLSFTLEFIGERTEEPRRVTCTITEEDTRNLETLIREVWRKIHALDFTPVDPSYIDRPSQKETGE